MSENKIITEESLVQFFYRGLDEINKNSLCPLPQEFIWYSSEVLNLYTCSEKFFTSSNGRVSEKLLGVELLQAQQLTENEKKKIYKDIGDTILVQLGVFSKEDSLNSYYINIGKSAYRNMDQLNCSFYDIPNFYQLFSTSLEHVLNVLIKLKEVLSVENFHDYFLVNNMPVNKKEI